MGKPGSVPLPPCRAGLLGHAASPLSTREKRRTPTPWILGRRLPNDTTPPPSAGHGSPTSSASPTSPSPASAPPQSSATAPTSHTSSGHRRPLPSPAHNPPAPAVSPFSEHPRYCSPKSPFPKKTSQTDPLTGNILPSPHSPTKRNNQRIHSPCIPHNAQTSLSTSPPAAKSGKQPASAHKHQQRWHPHQCQHHRILRL